MDSVSVDRLLAELRPLLLGRSLDGARVFGDLAVSFDIGGVRGRRLVFDTARSHAGVFVLPSAALSPAKADVPGETRHSQLLLRKHVAGARLLDLRRVAGHRLATFDAGAVQLVFRWTPPALTLVRDGEAVATLGEGSPAWPEPSPGVDFVEENPEAFSRRVSEGVEQGLSLARAILAASPTLGVDLARRLDGSASGFAALLTAVADARPLLIAAGPPDRLSDADVASVQAVAIAPVDVARPGETATAAGSWIEAVAEWHALRMRGERFAARRRSAGELVARETRRKTSLLRHLRADIEKGGDPATLRRGAEALLAAPDDLLMSRDRADVPDPYEPGKTLSVSLDPALGPRGTADRLFERARRLEKARVDLAARLAKVERELVDLADRARLVEAARDARDLPDANPRTHTSAVEAGGEGGPRRYLTSRGLQVLVGRGARENQELTFRIAKPEDLWFHVRDRPGAHVVLRDNEGRSTADDLREAAEIAAFFSDARGESQVDVHSTRRKHLRPAKGAPGRVLIGHAETLRVAPRDPEGRLRRR